MVLKFSEVSMCYMNCIYENWEGDCTKSNFPTGWLCPHESEECSLCGGVFHVDDVVDGLCQECLEEGCDGPEETL